MTGYTWYECTIISYFMENMFCCRPMTSVANQSNIPDVFLMTTIQGLFKKKSYIKKFWKESISCHFNFSAACQHGIYLVLFHHPWAQIIFWETFLDYSLWKTISPYGLFWKDPMSCWEYLPRVWELLFRYFLTCTTGLFLFYDPRYYSTSNLSDKRKL